MYIYLCVFILIYQAGHTRRGSSEAEKKLSTKYRICVRANMYSFTSGNAKVIKPRFAEIHRKNASRALCFLHFNYCLACFAESMVLDLRVEIPFGLVSTLQRVSRSHGQSLAISTAIRSNN